MAADKIAAACVRNFPSSCSPARPPPLRIPHNVSRRPQYCPLRPDVVLDSRAHTRAPLLLPGTDLPRHLRTCGPIERPARYPPLEKTSSALQPTMLPRPQPARPFPQFPAPRWPQDPAELDTRCGTPGLHPDLQSPPLSTTN